MNAATPQDGDGVVARLRAAGCVFAEDEARLLAESARTPAELDELVTRRVRGLPVEHLVGWAEFAGRRITVAPGVFVPRRRTEFLAEQAVALARPGAVVLDLCCGSGAVGAVVAAAVPVRLHAAELDPAAVSCARRNLAGSGQVHQGDLYTPLPSTLRGRVDVLTLNAPYVPTEALALMPPEARLHEPSTALDGGADGLDLQRRAITEAPHWLAPGATLLVETSEHQAPHTAELCTDHGMRASVSHCEDREATVVLARR